MDEDTPEIKQQSFETAWEVRSVIMKALATYLLEHSQVGIRDVLIGQAFAIGGIIIGNVKVEHQLEIMEIVTSAMMSSLKEVYTQE